MTARLPLSTHVTDEPVAFARKGDHGDQVVSGLGVLSVHLEGGRCRVGCEFCYLGGRTEEVTVGNELQHALRPEVLQAIEAHVACLSFDELAVAVNEPAGAALPVVRLLGTAAHRRGRPFAITTTSAVAAAHPELLDEADRVNLSVDPRKGKAAVSPDRIEELASSLKARRSPAQGPLDVVLIASLITPEFAGRLLDEGLLAQLVELPSVDKVALNALKPPPPWCDRAFWLRALGRIQPLLANHLDRKLFLDCYVAARILGIGPCPARPDLTPAVGGGLAFRACVYQPTLDFISHDAAETQKRLAQFVAPATCPFPVV